MTLGSISEKNHLGKKLRSYWAILKFWLSAVPDF